MVVRLPGGSYLSHCPELRVENACDKNGSQWTLIGRAVQTSAGLPEPKLQIQQTETRDVPTLYRSWAGRWLLIGDNKLHLDAAGLLGCFYHVTASHPPAVSVSSSAGLLAGELRLDQHPTRVLGQNLGIDWYTPPGSRFASVRRLLPSQILDLSSGSLLPRRLYPQLIAATYDNALDFIQACLVNALRTVAAQAETLFLPLTAGRDSRTLLAAAAYARIPVRCFTLGYRFMSDADRRLPPELAKAAGFHHTFIEPQRFSRGLANIFDVHTAGHTIDQDRSFIARQQFQWVTADDVILRGVGLEIGCLRAPCRNRLRRNPFCAEVPDGTAIAAVYRERNKNLGDALEQWSRWANATPHHELDWRDRFYIEQRLAGWASSIEQGLDLIDAECFHTGNNQMYFGSVAGLPEDVHVSSRHQYDLIRRMTPGLLSHPFNPRDPHGRYMVKKILRRIERMAQRQQQ
jgi:hypothetical protein